MNQPRTKKLLLMVLAGVLCASAAIVGVRAAVSLPAYMRAVQHAREAVLKEDLHTMRSAERAYIADKKQPVTSLNALVKGGYLETIPTDPMTKSSATWIISQGRGESDKHGGDSRIHSGSEAAGSDGRLYNTW